MPTCDYCKRPWERTSKYDRCYACVEKNRREVSRQAGKCTLCHTELAVKAGYCFKCQADQNRRRFYRKITALLAYGHSCACCGETLLAFLTIDHINGNGNHHRKDFSGGSKIFDWLIANDFPPGFQILCFKCNAGKNLNKGICPHEKGHEKTS